MEVNVLSLTARESTTGERAMGERDRSELGEGIRNLKDNDDAIQQLIERDQRANLDLQIAGCRIHLADFHEAPSDFHEAPSEFHEAPSEFHEAHHEAPYERREKWASPVQWGEYNTYATKLQIGIYAPRKRSNVFGRLYK